jgi:cysteine synthase/rhodanese-related sulfurtransferase
MNQLNVFKGKDSILDFLNPDNNPYTPMVEIPDHLNPYRKDGVRIFAKLMNMLPLSNVKSLPAYNMLLNKKENEELKNIDTVIENSSGNTVFSLAVIARLMGIPHTKSISSHQVSRGKLNILRFLGTEVIINEEPICPDPNDKTSGIYKAKVWAKENNWFNPGQYDNEHNPESHYKWTGPQIWEQTDGKISLLSIGLGTTGTVTGIGKYLKEKDKNIEIIGVHRSPNNPVPGVRTDALLRQISFDWESQVNYREEVGTIESFKKSLELCRAGLFVGPSSGFAFAGLLNYLSKKDLSDNKEKIVVFICPDGPFPYIDEYFEYLDESNFPKIENEHLLKKEEIQIIKNIQNNNIKEFLPLDLYKTIFEEKPNIIWDKIKNSEKINVNNKYILVDVRDEYEYQEHHIPGSLNIPFIKIDEFLKKNKRNKNNFVFICKKGNTSRMACYKADIIGIKNIYNLNGGIIEWSKLNLPRIRNNSCIINFGLDK